MLEKKFLRKNIKTLGLLLALGLCDMNANAMNDVSDPQLIREWKQGLAIRGVSSPTDDEVKAFLYNIRVKNKEPKDSVEQLKAFRAAGIPFNIANAEKGLEKARAEEERQRAAEAARQRIAEAERQRAAEAARQRAAEAARQRIAEAERQRPAEAARQRIAEAAAEKAERQRIAEAERQRIAEAARQRIAEAERQRTAEAERQRAAEAERQRPAEAERQRIAEAAAEKAERQRAAEAERQRIAEAERQRAAEAARRRAAEEDPRRIEEKVKEKEEKKPIREIEVILGSLSKRAADGAGASKGQENPASRGRRELPPVPDKKRIIEAINHHIEGKNFDEAERLINATPILSPEDKNNLLKALEEKKGDGKSEDKAPHGKEKEKHNKGVKVKDHPVVQGPPPPPPSKPSVQAEDQVKGKGGLLSSIENFNKNNLKKVGDEKIEKPVSRNGGFLNDIKKFDKGNLRKVGDEKIERPVDGNDGVLSQIKSFDKSNLRKVGEVAKQPTEQQGKLSELSEALNKIHAGMNPDNVKTDDNDDEWSD